MHTISSSRGAENHPLKACGMRSAPRGEEIWRPVFHYEHEYEVSNYGKIRQGTRIISLGELSDGYFGVNLNGKNFRVHRLVAIAFIPNPYRKEQVNHIDGNKKNNLLENLEWCTAKENDSHARKMGLKKWCGYNATRPKLTPYQVKYIRKSNLSQRVLAKKFGVSHPTIGDIKRGSAWKNI